MQFQHLFYFRSTAVSLKVSESDKGTELHYLDINLLQMRNDQLDAPTQKYSAVKMYWMVGYNYSGDDRSCNASLHVWLALALSICSKICQIYLLNLMSQ